MIKYLYRQYYAAYTGIFSEKARRSKAVKSAISIMVISDIYDFRKCMIWTVRVMKN